MKQLRRYPVSTDSLIRDMLGREGRVVALVTLIDGLPGATVKWFDGETSNIALGYLESAERGGLE